VEGQAVESFVPQFHVLPLLVFVAELCVVTIGTVRIIFVSRGRKVLAPLLGFFEVTIWLFAIGQIMQNLTDISCYLAFAGGFTLGNFLGVLIEKRLAIGSVVVQVTTNRDAGDLIAALRTADYGVTSMDAHGANGPVRVVFTVIKRRELDSVRAIVRDFDPKAFYAVNDLQAAAAGIGPAARGRGRGSLVPAPLRLFRTAA
jgi:uncharacterized protein YebE (UPF0316 family)